MLVAVGGVRGGNVVEAVVEGVSRPVSGRSVRAGWRRGLLVFVVRTRGGSGMRGERANRVEDGGEVGLPWPAGGESECPATAGAGQAGGDLE